MVPFPAWVFWRNILHSRNTNRGESFQWDQWAACKKKAVIWWDQKRWFNDVEKSQMTVDLFGSRACSKFEGFLSSSLMLFSMQPMPIEMCKRWNLPKRWFQLTWSMDINGGLLEPRSSLKPPIKRRYRSAGDVTSIGCRRFNICSSGSASQSGTNWCVYKLITYKI